MQERYVANAASSSRILGNKKTHFRRYEVYSEGVDAIGFHVNVGQGIRKEGKFTGPKTLETGNQTILCGLVVRVPDYRSRGPDSIPGDARFTEK
jgi:hypothetical protein